MVTWRVKPNDLDERFLDVIIINSFKDGLFGGMLVDDGGMGGDGGKKDRQSKISHTYLTIMNLGTAIPYLKKIQKIYKPPKFC